MTLSIHTIALFIVIIVCCQPLIGQGRRSNTKRVDEPPICVHKNKEEHEKNLFCPEDSGESSGQAGGIEARDKHRCTALMRAAENGKLDVLRDLLKNGADVRAEMGGQTSLTLAAKEGHLEIVKALLTAGADPNVRDMTFHFGESWPLMSAMDRCNKDWPQIVDAMIAAGAELEPKAGFSRSPFMYAIEKHDIVLTRALLARGANINAKNVGGFTPLMAAALGSDPKMVRFLIASGADVSFRNSKGQTALDVARELKSDFPNASIDDVIRVLNNATLSRRNAKG